MARIVISKASVLTLDENDTFYYPGTVEIEGDRITKVYAGPPITDADEDASTTFIDGTDKLVMPGLVDLHFHTSVAKGFNDVLPLKEYLEEVWYPSIRALNKERAYTAAMYSYCCAIKSGTTTVNDMYRFIDSLADAAARIGIRAVLSNEVALAEHELDSLEDNAASHRKNHGRKDGRIQVWLGHEWMCTSDWELMRQVGRMKKELGMGLHIHLSESAQEVRDVKAQFDGRTPVEVAYETGCLGPDVVAAHCVHLTDRDIQLLAETATSVSYDPGSNAKLGNGVAPLQRLRAAGINIGMGIDAFECENSPDMFELMKFGSLIQRAVHQDSSLGMPSDILRMATKNGARALGIEAGTITVGSKADVIMVDLTNQMFTPLLEEPAMRKTMLESHLVFGCNGSAVQHSIIDGKLVLRDFKVVAVDEEALRKEMDATFAAIVKDMKSLVVKPDSR